VILFERVVRQQLVFETPKKNQVIVYRSWYIVAVMKADAGMADLDVTATSPSGQEIPLQVTPLNDGAEMIEFSPSVPGTYMINVTYGNNYL
jgi:hypothetical protein